MPVLDIDLTSIGVIKDGTYVATIVSQETKQSKSGDGSYINWVLFIPEQNQNIFHITSLKPAALFGLKNLLVAAGVSISNTGFNTDDAIGKQVNITIVTVESPEFGMQSKITKITKL